MRSTTTNRRIKARFAAPSLRVHLIEKGFLGREKTALDVHCLDINRYGLAVISARPLSPGTRLSLDFSGKYINESGVPAQITSCLPYQAGYRLGIQFRYCCSQQDYTRAMDNALSRIEGFYNRLAG
ncbi:PilZ domain-containing protein [Marinobacter bohaiensis]|uniref:PilZ domain-containing protein n=1 Tax=Marinobacter bohaiensis TaxID=2201898 RepID=UPI000DABF415|nr:PilZ domain-containing protein [Marinobacter bohaiensis]